MGGWDEAVEQWTNKMVKWHSYAVPSPIPPSFLPYSPYNPSLSPEEQERLAPMRVHPDVPGRNYQEEISRLLSTPFGFVQWLYSKRVDEVVGIAGLASGCPIQHFIQEVMGDGVRDIMVGGGGIRWKQSGRMEAVQLPLQSWATSFIGEIDRYGALHGNSITANDAHLVLNRIGVRIPPTQSVLEMVASEKEQKGEANGGGGSTARDWRRILSR